MTADSDSHDNWQPGRICRRIESLELGASRYGAHVTERPADSDFIRSSRTAAKSRTGCNIGATEVRILSAVLVILVRFPIFSGYFGATEKCGKCQSKAPCPGLICEIIKKNTKIQITQNEKSGKLDVFLTL